MTTTTSPPSRNGVDVATLFATLDAVKGQNEIAKFQFRATQHLAERHPQPLGVSPASTARCRRWQHQHVTVVDSDHPEVLVGQDNAPTPVEYLLHAHRRLPDLRHRQHRLRPRRRPHQGQLDRRGRHRPARHPRAVGRLGPQRLRGASGSPSTSRATPTRRRCASIVEQSRRARPSTTR